MPIVALKIHYKVWIPVRMLDGWLIDDGNLNDLKNDTEFKLLVQFCLRISLSCGYKQLNLLPTELSA